jgi:hypothetical protein
MSIARGEQAKERERRADGRNTHPLSRQATDGAGVGDAIPLPKRGGPKGLPPTTWLSRGVRVEYRDASGQAQTLSSRLMDTFPRGMVVGANGTRTLLSWGALVLCELEAS